MLCSSYPCRQRGDRPAATTICSLSPALGAGASDNGAEFTVAKAGTFSLGSLAEERSKMPSYLMKVTDMRNFWLEVGELQLKHVNINDSKVMKGSRKFAKDLLRDQPELANRGLCLTISDEGGTICFMAPMDTIH
jgi:hypothetical protein